MSNIVTTFITVGLVMLPLVPAALGQTQTATASTPSDQQSFRSRVSDDMAAWRVKIDGYETSADAKGKHAADETRTRLHAAWANVQAQAQNLQTASVEGWSSVKASYETASAELRTAWEKAVH